MLNFDSSEKWRPLNVDMFLNETDPTTGGPWNQICTTTTVPATCTGLMGTASLQSPYGNNDSYISIHRDSNSDPDSIRRRIRVSADEPYGTSRLLDCDSGPASAIYYNVVGPSRAVRIHRVLVLLSVQSGDRGRRESRWRLGGA